jgi:hypothetical protein
VAFSDYSTTPSLNVTIGGLSSAEGCAAANVNNILRQLAADGRALYDTVAAINTSTLMPKSGGVFTGAISRTSAGGYWYHAASAQADGKVYIVATGTARPSSPAEGTVRFLY